MGLINLYPNSLTTLPNTSSLQTNSQVFSAINEKVARGVKEYIHRVSVLSEMMISDKLPTPFKASLTFKYGGVVP